MRLHEYLRRVGASDAARADARSLDIRATSLRDEAQYALESLKAYGTSLDRSRDAGAEPSAYEYATWQAECCKEVREAVPVRLTKKSLGQRVADPGEVRMIADRAGAMASEQSAPLVEVPPLVLPPALVAVLLLLF